MSGSEFKPSVKERIAFMYVNEWLSDVHFLVGAADDRESIPAHSFVLSVASSPFAAMLLNGFETKAEIDVPDVNPVAFKVLLKYLYTDEIELRVDSVLAVLYAAKKYLIASVFQAAVDFIEANLDANNVCLVLMQRHLFEEEDLSRGSHMQRHLFEEEDLVKRCYEVVDAHAEKVFCSEGFLDIDYVLFKEIISRDTLVVREHSVHEAVVKWAKAENKRRNLPYSSSDLRSTVGDAVYSIRFPTMSGEEFVNEGDKLELLTYQEAVDIFDHIFGVEKPSMAFSVLPCEGLPLQICSRFLYTSFRPKVYCDKAVCDSIKFSVDRRIFVSGYGLYGSRSKPSVHKVKMELKREEDALETLETSYCSTGFPDSFPVHFNSPVQIDANVVYTASVITEGTVLSYYGHEEMPEVRVHLKRRPQEFAEKRECVTFFFTPSENDLNGPVIKGGQIPEIMFYV